MGLKNKESFIELIEKYRLEILNNEDLLEKIEEKIEDRQINGGEDKIKEDS